LGAPKKLKTVRFSIVFRLINLTGAHALLALGLLLGCISQKAIAQDQTNFAQFYLNPYILNASYVGIDGKTSASLLYRKQWMTINGGPTIANFSLHSPFSKRTSGGISITNDQRGILNNTALLLTFGYNVSIKENTFLRFGISGGAGWNMIDLAQLDGFNDQAIGNILNNSTSIAGNAGLSFHSKNFHFGIAVPSVFQPSIISTDGFNVTKVNPLQTTIIHVSNRFYFNNNKNVFEPYALYRLNATTPSQFEFAGVLHLNHVLWMGGSYKQDFGISALAGIKLKNTLAIGGAYSLKNSGINELNSPSFEICLNYLLGKHKKGAPVYSFVDTHKIKEKKTTHPTNAPARKLTQEEIARKKRMDEQAKRHQEELAKKKDQDAEFKKKQELALKQHQEEIKRRVEARKNDVVKVQPQTTVTIPVKKDSVATPVVHNPRFKHQMLMTFEEEGHPQHEQQQLRKLELYSENPMDPHNEANHANAERHEFIKRGNHTQELDVSDYVIGGVFKSIANAKHFSDGLTKLGFHAHYGHLTEKNLWYVYLIQTHDINIARAERDRVRKLKILHDAWLLTVHH
jgi:type IX secretion system PorP/SprF family membrane protein